MSTLMLEAEPAAVQVIITDEKLIVELADGRGISVPLAWYPRLQHRDFYDDNPIQTP
jgi:hypothetical protein